MDLCIIAGILLAAVVIFFAMKFCFFSEGISGEKKQDK